MTDRPLAKARLPIERVAWLAYWLAFTAMAVRGGFDPGFVRDADPRPYPWLGVAWTATLLGALTFGLLRVLSLGTFGWSWWRWGAAIVLAGMFAVWEIATVATDLPGFMYVAPLYALVTLAGLATAGVVALLSAGIRRLSGRFNTAA